MVRWGLRALFLTHRWVGVVLALLMAVWAVSGVVMMYVAFPETTEEERLAGLEPLDLSKCCEAELPDILALDAARVEMRQGAPVLHWQGGGTGGAIRLTDGNAPAIDKAAAMAIASDHLARSTGKPAPKPSVSKIELDQWSVYGSFRAHRPLFKVSFPDAAGTVLYISSRDGTVLQDTTAHERFWNWLGAVPHWLYFTAIRDNVPLWSNIVIYSTLLGIFLTVTGIYLGIRQYGRGKRRIPYRGMAWWHHVTGLVFGLFTLTWVVSGLFSMNPWGWMESKGAASETAALAGRPMDQADLVQMIEALRGGVPAGTKLAELAVQDGKAYALLADAEGKRRRFALPALAEAPSSEAELRRRVVAAIPDATIASQAMLREPDAYYYGHKSEVALPVWRAIYADEEETRLYFDPATGELLRKVDAPARAFRWWHLGLHRLDFAQSLRSRPLWDIVTLPLLLGVSLLCLVGLWLGVRRLVRTLRFR